MNSLPAAVHDDNLISEHFQLLQVETENAYLQSVLYCARCRVVSGVRRADIFTSGSVTARHVLFGVTDKFRTGPAVRHVETSSGVRRHERSRRQVSPAGTQSTA